MGVKQHYAILATTWSFDAFKGLREWIARQNYSAINTHTCEHHSNRYMTIAILPDGPINPFKSEEEYKKFRDAFIQAIKYFDFCDGSNPFDWVEIRYGDLGQEVLRGNCEDKYGGREAM